MRAEQIELIEDHAQLQAVLTELHNDFCVSYWLKDRVREIMERDANDVYWDAK